MTKIRSKFERSTSTNNIQLPPWCSRIKPKTQLNSTLSSDKTNILNISNGRSKKLQVDNRKRVPRLLYVQNYKKTSSKCCFFTKCVIAVAIITGTYFLWNGIHIPSAINLVLNSELKESLSVPEECYARLTQLQAALSRTEYALKRNWRRGVGNKKQLLVRPESKFSLMEKATISIGPGTKEWAGGRAMLWGIIPLWRTSPSPYTILSIKKLTPGDCWPFIGSHGKVTIELPRRALISNFSIEHIRPDSAKSAPRHFSLHIIFENGTHIKNLEQEYRKEGSVQQFYDFHFQDPLNRISFHVLSNHGNQNYTCIYRLHLHGHFIDTV